MLTVPASPLHRPFRYWLRAAPWLVRFAASAKPRRVAEIADALAFLLADSVSRHQDLATEVGCPDIVRQTGHLHLYPDERSEEHTSELQSLMRISYAVFCLKKKN